MKLSKLKVNPGNPRFIKDERFTKLVQSIKDFPQMMSLRPIVVNPEFTILGGNMRYKACQHLGMKEIPDEWVKIAEGLTEEEQKRFIIEDNVPFGEWDWDIIANEWNTDELQAWGMDIPTGWDKPEIEDKKPIWIPDCLYASNNIYDIPTLLIEKQAKTVDLPIKPYGADRRDGKDVGTYHFYVDDYRFETIWDRPENIIHSGCINIVEPNISIFDTTPISYGLFQIYKKRWIARFLQDEGINIFADLNVSKKYYEYNALGIPEGWNAFSTRGYTDRIDYLIQEIEIAKQISGKDNPFMVIYGGGAKIHEITAKYNLIYVEQFMNVKD